MCIYIYTYIYIYMYIYIYICERESLGRKCTYILIDSPDRYRYMMGGSYSNAVRKPCCYVSGPSHMYISKYTWPHSFFFADTGASPKRTSEHTSRTSEERHLRASVQVQ